MSKLEVNKTPIKKHDLKTVTEDRNLWDEKEVLKIKILRLDY